MPTRVRVVGSAISDLGWIGDHAVVVTLASITRQVCDREIPSLGAILSSGFNLCGDPEAPEHLREDVTNGVVSRDILAVAHGEVLTGKRYNALAVAALAAQESGASAVRDQLHAE